MWVCELLKVSTYNWLIGGWMWLTKEKACETESAGHDSEEDLWDREPDFQL